MPWKNGQGTTTELAVHPEGADLDGFTWRISMADLSASGPFSTFAGVDRILVQIAGAPMTLAHDDGPEHLLALLVPYRFAGELATHGALGSKTARDFNVMVRRVQARAELAVHVLAPSADARADGDEDTRVVFLLEGSADVTVGAETIALGCGETLIAERATQVGLVAGAQGATAFLASIAGATR